MSQHMYLAPVIEMVLLMMRLDGVMSSTDVMKYLE